MSANLDGLKRSVIARLGACNLDELRVVDQLLVRLELGRDRYGHLDLAQRRDWARERAEEAADYAVYDACLLLSQRDEAMRAIAAAPVSDRTLKTALVAFDTSDGGEG
jgi:hypothetical protein